MKSISKKPIQKGFLNKKLRHFKTELAIAVDHPYVIKNNPSKKYKICLWIIADLRKKFLHLLIKVYFLKILYRPKRFKI